MKLLFIEQGNTQKFYYKEWLGGLAARCQLQDIAHHATKLVETPVAAMFVLCFGRARFVALNDFPVRLKIKNSLRSLGFKVVLSN